MTHGLTCNLIKQLNYSCLSPNINLTKKDVQNLNLNIISSSRADKIRIFAKDASCSLKVINRAENSPLIK